jgi:hypothetical protein
MGDIVDGRDVGEFPPLIAALVLGLNCRHRPCDAPQKYKSVFLTYSNNGKLSRNRGKP